MTQLNSLTTRKWVGIIIGLLMVGAVPGAHAHELTNAPLEQQHLTDAPYNVYIDSATMGSGPQDKHVAEKAWYWGNGLYSIARYIPGSGTAHMAWSRAIDVKCTESDGKVLCDSFTILSQQGQNRGEWILFHPIIDRPVPPVAPVVTVIHETTNSCPCTVPILKKHIRQ